MTYYNNCPQCGCGYNCNCGCHYNQGQAHGCDCNKEGECCCAEKFLDVADEAWMEVLKEKIKEHIYSEKSDDMHKLAKLISNANCHRWEYKMKAKLNSEKYKDDLMDYLKDKE